MSEHPSLFRLDAHAAGDESATVIEHLKTCEACAAYVAEAQAGAAAFRAKDDSADFLAALQTRRVVPIERPRRFPMARAAWMTGALLAAAATLLVLRGSHDPNVVALNEEMPTRFKGNIQLAAIRDRAGGQARLTTEVRVKPGDRVRVEVGVDDARPLEIGFLGKDGTWVLLMAPTNLEAGTSFSERSARFDDTPTEGWIIAGHPNEIERAKSTRKLDSVRSMAVRVEP